MSKTHRISALFKKKARGILSLYFTAGYPLRDQTLDLVKFLDQAGVDMLEIGMPYSDPVADGPIIQSSNQKALENGMSVRLLMQQLINLRKCTEMPVMLMGYINPIIQYGMKRFCQDCEDRGIDGLIIPDLPMQEYLDHYRETFNEHGLHNVFLVTPQTSEERIRWIDKHSEGFIYAVSDASITGAEKDISEKQKSYFNRLSSMKLQHPFLIGFGIYDHHTFSEACKYAQGAIIGSAFIKSLDGVENLQPAVQQFVQSLKSD